MNKTALRTFAVTVRKKLENAVKQKAYTFGITEEGIQELEELGDGLVVNGTVMGERELKQYNHLKNRIRTEGYQKVMDEAAYTWFNRFVAMRYMEVNDFLPIHMRVLSSENANIFEPDALKNVLEIADDLDMNKERIYTLQDDNRLNDLYQYLLIKQSNKLGDSLPNVFDPITDDLALLLPDNLLNENSVIRDFVTLVDEEDWKEVEIVGWLYQFYISEEKESFFENRSKKAGKEDIPSATQLFTPRWIVEYMVDNSLGRLWLESHDDDPIKESLTYYLDDVDDIEKKLDSNVDVETLSFLDPSSGSGHILVYAFEVFYKLYESRGYLKRDIPKLILDNNLFGLDIDKRATQLATFAVMMKAREYDRRLFSRDFSVHIHSIEESNKITEEQIDLFSKDNQSIKENVKKLISTFYDAKLYGSIIQVPEIDIQLIEKQLSFIREDADIDIFTTELIEYVFPLLEDLINQYQLLEKQYDVVVTNPPYMGSKSIGQELKKYINKKYKEYNKDLFSVFVYRCSFLVKSEGYTAFMTPMVWMFISSYEKLRQYIVQNKTISSLVHLEYSAFEEATVPLCTFVLKNNHENPIGTYIRLSDFIGGMKVQEEKYLEAVKNPEISYRYKTNSDNFSKIPGSPIAYWASDEIFDNFYNNNNLKDKFKPFQGLIAGNNELFLKRWTEVDIRKINFSIKSIDNINQIDSKWYPIVKGGNHRKWFGNNEFIINYENDGEELKKNAKSKYGSASRTIKSLEYSFLPTISWNLITSGELSVRWINSGFMYNVAGPAIYNSDKQSLIILLGQLNSKIGDYILKILNPTLNLNINDLENFPIIKMTNESKVSVVDVVKQNKIISESDWDAFEISWDFEEHPFLTYKEDSSLLEDSFNKWNDVAEERFYQLKENEEELNRIFIDIYGLQDELTPEVKEKDVTVRKADKERDVKSFLSYLVGLMFGRYSLDKKGLDYAGGEWDNSNFSTYQPDQTNIIPLTDEQYFEDDIMNKVEDLLQIIYGKESVEENLTFIAEALKKKANESSRDRIRRYFMKEFYKDHLKTYKKRPIYWQFSSGRRGAFKGLMYLHRYNKNTIGLLRTDYVLHESKVLENLIELEEQVVNDETSSKTQQARAQKTIETFEKDREEIAEYSNIIDHVAKQQIELDLDDGVKVNHAKFQNIELATDDTSRKKQNVFDKI